jgi:hypothetical protein
LQRRERRDDRQSGTGGGSIDGACGIVDEKARRRAGCTCFAVVMQALQGATSVFAFGWCVVWWQSHDGGVLMAVS